MARKNTQKAVEAWIGGKTYRAPGRNGSPIWTQGGVIYSYRQPIGKWSDADPHTAILNTDRFSVTTSCQQGGIREILTRRGKKFVLCSDTNTFNLTER